METKIKTNTIVGILVILIGSLFLLKNFGFLPEEIFESILKWQLILILVGAAIYFNSNKSVGLTLIIVGGLFWIPDIWPLLLVLLGGFIIYRNQKPNLSGNSDPIINDYDPKHFINDISIFGGAKKSVQVDNFRGGNITAIFGGSEIDLMDCNLAEGTNKLEIFFMFGGTNLKIPSNWNVLIQVISIFGAFKDKRIVQQNQEANNSKTLIISGIALFGGGELKNYVKF